ncbi:11562_t:CDS:2, partial [Gigaspora margarita]
MGFTLLAVQTKEELIKEIPKEVLERLAKLELKKGKIEKVSQVFKTVMIALVILSQLYDNTISDEKDYAFGL